MKRILQSTSPVPESSSGSAPVDERRPGTGPTRRPVRRGGFSPSTFLGALSVLLVVSGAITLSHFLNPGIVHRVSIEAGSGVPAATRFVSNPRFSARYASDVSWVDTSKPGMYTLKIQIADTEYDVTLDVSDTTPPTGDPVDATTWKGEPLDPSRFVANPQDVAAVTVTFASPPDFDEGGEQEVSVVLTDTSGNRSEIQATLTVLLDTDKPVIAGVVDLDVFIGDSVAYRTGVTVTDNHDTDVLLEIDNSDVNLSAAGTYTVVYSATDQAGNCAEVPASVTVKAKPEGYVSLSELNAKIDEIFTSILKPGMTDLETLSEIFYYIADHITYTGTSEKGDWVSAAYIGITRGSGDCYNYFALAKGMLDRAGYETIPLERVSTARTRHYWNLVKYNGEWYHYDPLPYLPRRQYVCLLRTEAEVALYSSYSTHMYYIYDHAGIPAAATTTLHIERRIINND